MPEDIVTELGLTRDTHEKEAVPRLRPEWNIEGKSAIQIAVSALT